MSKISIFFTIEVKGTDKNGQNSNTIPAKQRYLPNFRSDKGLKSTVVSRTRPSLNEG